MRGVRGGGVRGYGVGRGFWSDCGWRVKDFGVIMDGEVLQKVWGLIGYGVMGGE